MPAIPDLPDVFYVSIMIFRGHGPDGERALYTEEILLNGASFMNAVKLVGSGDLWTVWCVEPGKGKASSASSQVANTWFSLHANDWPEDKPWPEFITDYCEFSLHRQEPGKKYYSSTEDSPH